MLVKNSFEYDARVTKEAVSLIDAGHEVTVVAILVPDVTPEREVKDGIQVVRVPRMQFLVPELNRVARRYARWVERRRARLLGVPVDEEAIAELGTFHVASTATPGDAATEAEPIETATPADGPEPSATAPTSLKYRYGAATTAALRAAAMSVKKLFKLAKFLLGKQGRAAKTYAINRRFIAAAIAQRPDVVHAHDLNTLWAATVVKRRTGAKLVYDSHELATARNRMGFWWKQWASYWERRGIPHADEVIMAAPGYADAAVQRYGVEPPTVILNVPTLQVPDLDPAWDLRRELDLPRDKHLIVYQGSIQENRGIEQVIDAMAHVHDSIMVVIGYGYHRPALERLVRDRGWTDRVRFFGPVPNHELINWTASADLGVCCIVGTSPSYYHSLPNKLFEYLMAGVPVIASDFPGMGGITKQTDVGEVCDPEDPASIGAAMLRVLDDPERAERYRRNAKTAIERYNWAVEAERLQAIYDRLARSS
jgi:glycosyltransferase involved in cell wall biosynthesis